MLTDKLYRSLRTAPMIQAQVRRVVKKLPHRLRIIERFGQRFIIDPSELSGFYLYYEREYDDFVFQFLDNVIQKYSAALDIGANIGIYTCYLAAGIKHIDAFEPDPFLCSWLKRNLAVNSLTNVLVHEACVGSERGSVAFFPANRRNRGTGSMIGTGEGSIERYCIRLDDFLLTGPKGPCLIKMDIEGAEWLALQGARKLLSLPDASIDILLEVHPQEIQTFGGSVNALKLLLFELGYAVAALTPRGPTALNGSEEVQRFWWVSRDPIIVH